MNDVVIKRLPRGANKIAMLQVMSADRLEHHGIHAAMAMQVTVMTPWAGASLVPGIASHHSLTHFRAPWPDPCCQSSSNQMQGSDAPV